MTNPEDITDPTTAMNMALALMAKAFKLNYSTPTNNNQRISSNQRNRQIAQPGMNMGQDRQIQMIGSNGGNQFRQYAGNLNGYNAVQNVENQKEEGGIQLQAEEYDLMAVAADLDEIKEVNANCILMANLQQASSSGTQTDSAPVYDTDGSAEVHENYDNIEIFNMFTQEEQYTELLEPILEPQQVPQNDNNFIFEVADEEQDGETVEQHSVNFEETRALCESLYQNLAVEVVKVNSNYLQQPMLNPEDITDSTTAMNMALALMAKAFRLNYSTLTNNNQRISSNPRNRKIAQPGMNMGQDRQMQMTGGNGGNQFRQYAEQNVRNQNGLIGVQGNENQNQIGNGNLVAVRAEGNAARHNGNQLRCYNCRGVGHFARDCTVRPGRRDVAYLQTQLLIAQKEEAGI
nr:hypothetical protein [Tanacetum cinerariifolium]